MRTRPFICLCASVALVAFSAAGAQRLEDAYFAPENQLVFKMVLPGGEVRQFERDYSRPGMLRSLGGWSARFVGKSMVEVSAGNPAGRISKLVFDRGRLVGAVTNGVPVTFAYDLPRRALTEYVPPLEVRLEDSRAAAIAYAENEFRHKWDGTGRLAFPFVNPNQNGALYAELFLCFLFAALAVRNRILACISWGGALLAFVCTVWTMSRGAWLGIVVGLLPLLLLKCKSVIRKRAFWGIVLAVLAVLALGLAILGPEQLMRGFERDGSMNWSNAVRVEIWKNAPRMFYAAPGGWGFCGAGAAYLNWFQPLQVFALCPTLINSHLTILAGLGWCGRFAYILAHTLFFLGALVVIVRRRSFLPFALGAAFFTAAWFNPMSHRLELWLLPVASAGLILRGLSWKPRAIAASFIASLTLAAAICGGICLRGAADAQAFAYIRAEGRRVKINGPSPRIWLVDDGTVGGGLTGKDIREYYSVIGAAPALGYVTDIADIPSGVEKLVLVGQRCSDWLTRLSEDESARGDLPSTVILVSPPFPPSCIPPALLAACRVKVLVGEFAARYDPEYATAPAWVEQVAGMERYILRWMERVIGE